MEVFDRQLPSVEAYRSGGDVYRTPVDIASVSLREVLTKFWVRKRLVLLCIIVCAGLGLLLTKVREPVYVGQAEIAIKPKESGLLVGDRSVPLATPVAPEMIQTEAFALQSRALASATIMQLHLDQDPEFNPSLRKPNPLLALLDPILALLNEVQGWLPGWIQSPSERSEPREAELPLDTDKFVGIDKPTTAVVDAFRSRLRVSAQARSSVIEILFSSSRPQTAAAVPNTLVTLYLDKQAADKDLALVQEYEQLEKVILPSDREKLETSGRVLAEYRQQSGLITDRNASLFGQELADARAQLASARARTEEAALRLQEAERTSPVPRTAADPVTIQHLREQEVALQGQLAALKGAHGPNYPLTVQLETQLKELKNGIRRESSEAIGRLQTTLTAAQETEAAVRKRVSQLTRQFALASGGDSKLQDLIGEGDADRKAYERHLARLSELRSSIGHAQPDASLLSPADLPLKPSPSAKLIALGGAVLGAGIGILWVTLLDGLLKGLRNETQIEEVLGIKCLGLVPKVQRPRRYSFRKRERPKAIRDFTLNVEYAEFGEAIRSAQLKLLRFDRQTESPVILITAALPNEGKSWVAASLAVSLAADGWSVALVDCDVNRPTVHRMFNGPRGPGLTDYLVGRVTFDEVIHSDPTSGLSYIPIGSAAARETWRKTFSLIPPLVDRLREKYAFVILDSPPVLAVSDTILLSQIAQKTILVVKWASTPPAVARRAAVQLLESAGAEVTALLSMVNTKRAAKNGDPIASVYKQLGGYYRR